LPGSPARPDPLGVPLLCLLLNVVAPVLRVFTNPAHPRAARVCSYAPLPASSPERTPAPAPSRDDYAAFCEVAEARAHVWPEIRRLADRQLPYVAADPSSGVHIASNDLRVFAAALDAIAAASAASGRRSGSVRPYVSADSQARRAVQRVPR